MKEPLKRFRIKEPILQCIIKRCLFIATANPGESFPVVRITNKIKSGSSLKNKNYKHAIVDDLVLGLLDFVRLLLKQERNRSKDFVQLVQGYKFVKCKPHLLRTV